MKHTIRALRATTALLLLAPGALAQLSEYSQDFESLDMANPSALGDDGWLGFANVFDSMGGYLYGYGTFPAPNGGPGCSAIGTGDGGPFQGSQYINVYSDYGNGGEHMNGNLVNALVFQEQVAGASNVGQTWRFSFDHRKNPVPVNGDGATTTQAFVKVIKISDMSFATFSIGRFAAYVQDSGAMGEVTFSPDLTSHPRPMGTCAIMAGDTRAYQYWTRDMNDLGMPTSNFSSAICITFH